MIEMTTAPAAPERSNRKKKFVAVTAAVVIGGGGAAFAYWTAGGSGTGSASTDNTTVALVVNQTSSHTELAPDSGTQTIAGNITNPNDEPIFVDSVTVSFGSIVKAEGAPAGTCNTTDYVLTNTTMEVDVQVAANSTGGPFSGAGIAFVNKPSTNQDACKGATVNLVYTVNGGDAPDA